MSVVRFFNRAATILACAAAAGQDRGAAQTLFEDHFDDNRMSPDWVSVKPSQWCQDEWLYTRDTGPGRDSCAVVHDGDPAWTDYTLQMKVDPLPTDPDWEHAFVLFRTRETAWREFFVRGCGYNLGLAGPGHSGGPSVALSRYWMEGDQHRSISLFERSGYVKSEPMDLEITVIGDRIQVSLDGLTVIDVVDPQPHLFGGIGIGAIWEAEARFDDVVVTDESPGKDRLAGACSLVNCNNRVVARLRKATPGEQVTFRFNGNPCSDRQVEVRPNGVAKARFSAVAGVLPSGRHTVEVVEYGFRAGVECP
ncbi:MAG: hypothetical protein C4547_15755 [Phycisphaerales bacterium]|nr:MAG: hypothetical protein C4547_15755 [Phycisphaerales bacterium]